MDKIYKKNVYCANCEFCKMVSKEEKNTKNMIYTRCVKNQWETKSGDEKFVSLKRIAYVNKSECMFYSSMGERLDDFMSVLKQTENGGY